MLLLAAYVFHGSCESLDAMGLGDITVFRPSQIPFFAHCVTDAQLDPQHGFTTMLRPQQATARFQGPLTGLSVYTLSRCCRVVFRRVHAIYYMGFQLPQGSGLSVLRACEQEMKLQ